jgi:TM2 domain-containing membrane protein YozV
MSTSDVGWRIDPHGVERWWDGYAWREPRHPNAGTSRAVVARPQSPAPYAPQHSYQQAYAQQPGPYGYAAGQPQMMVAPKELWLAYLLAAIVGTLGIHRMYLGRTGSGIAMLAIYLASVPLSFIGVGLIGLLALSIWWVVDLFLIPGMVRDENERRMHGVRWPARY